MDSATSPEHATVLENTATLVDCIKLDIHTFANDLISKHLIPQGLRETLRLDTLEASRKAAKIVDHITDSIRSDPSIYQTFVSVLEAQGDWVVECVRKVECCYEAKRAACKQEATSAPCGFVCQFCQKCTFEEYIKYGCPMSKEKPSPPQFRYLDTSQLDDQEKNVLEMKLSDDFKNIESAFGELCVEISSSNLAIDKIVIFLLSKTVFRTEDTLRAELGRATSMVDILKVICGRLISFFNYEILEEIIIKYGTSIDKEKLSSYLFKFSEYCEHNVFEVPQSKFHPTMSKRKCSCFALKYTEETPITIGQTKTACRNIASILKIDSWSLRLLSVEEGCIVLRLAVPQAVDVFPLSTSQVEALHEIKILIHHEEGGIPVVPQYHVQRSPPDSSLLSILPFLKRRMLPLPHVRSVRFMSASAPVTITPDDHLRYIVIDGSSVAMRHGNGGVFSCKGIQLAVDYFKKRGHTEIIVFVPEWRKEPPTPESHITDQHLLHLLEQDGYLKFTPSRRLGEGRRILCYDDRYIVKLAADEQGVIVSNDQFKHLMKENDEWKEVVETRLLQFTFENDQFVVPDAPLGRNGPSLDQFLSKDPYVTSQPMRMSKNVHAQPRLMPVCPHLDRCTFGSKCKYYHPERDSSYPSGYPSSEYPSGYPSGYSSGYSSEYSSRHSSGYSSRHSSSGYSSEYSELYPSVYGRSIGPTSSPSPNQRYMSIAHCREVLSSGYYDNMQSESPMTHLSDHLSSMSFPSKPDPRKHTRPQQSLDTYHPPIMKPWLSVPSLPTWQEFSLLGIRHGNRHPMRHKFPLINLPLTRDSTLTSSDHRRGSTGTHQLAHSTHHVSTPSYHHRSHSV